MHRGPAQDPDEQDELLLRERSMEAMEQRLLNAVRGVVRKEQQEQALSSAAPVPSSVTKALYGIPALKEKEFEVKYEGYIKEIIEKLLKEEIE